jgi:hypothetical protein
MICLSSNKFLQANHQIYFSPFTHLSNIPTSASKYTKVEEFSVNNKKKYTKRTRITTTKQFLDPRVLLAPLESSRLKIDELISN